MNRLSTDLQKLRSSSRSKSQREITGLLFGTAEEELLTAKTSRAFLSGVPEEVARTAFESLVALSKTDTETSLLQVIGWYSLRLDKRPGLLESDVEFHNLHFPQATDLALILRPEQKTGLVMELYCRTPELVLTSSEHRWSSVRLAIESPVDEQIDLAMRSRLSDDFYMRAYQVNRSLERAERSEEWKRRIEFGKTITLSAFQGTLERAARLPGRAAALVAARPALKEAEPAATSASAVTLYKNFDDGVSGLPALTAPKRAIPWFSSAVIFIFVAGACATFSVFYIQNRSHARQAISTPLVQSIPPVPNLGLHVETQADRLLLTWNRSGPIARAAAKGVLVIDDGTTHREVSLDAGQVADGSVLYKPASDDVSFRLELYRDHASTVTESMRVLDGTQATRAESSLPKLPSNASLSLASGSREPEQHEAITKPAASASLYGAQQTADSRHTAAVPIESATVPSFALQSPVLAKPALHRDPASRPAELPPVDTTAQTTTAIPLPIEAALPQVAAPQLPPNTPKPVASGGIQKVEQPHPVAAQAAVPAYLYVPPRALKQVMPDMSLFGRGVVSGITQIEIKVRVDSRGHVRDAHVLGKGKTNGVLSAAALVAAKQWSFAPATLHGNKVDSDHTIVFEFRPAVH